MFNISMIFVQLSGLFVLLHVSTVCLATQSTNQTMGVNKFLYFGYGSNLLAKRIHLRNPSASRAGIGKLKNYRLDFNGRSMRWKGAAATIVPDEGAHVWGALWEISNDDMANLDRQEGVPLGIYKVIPAAQVEKPEGEVVTCRSYQLIDLPPKLNEGESIPLEQLPSKVYMDTIIEGARESGLPAEYITKLLNIPHNGYSGVVNYDLD